MADMANLDQVEETWEEIAAITAIDRVVPITYMNSSAALKAFVGRKGGAVCTSSNARAVLEWALAKGDKVLFFPDQHLGRNTGFTMGYGEADMRVWNPHQDGGGLEERDVKDATLLLWKGHCSVHQRFRPAHVEAARAEHPGIQIIVHPECAHDVVELADRVGSTERIQEWVRAAPAGASLAIGTEIHMVQRLAREHADKTIVSLDPLICPCSTMFRIDAPHLAWVLESLIAGTVVNQIVVDDDTATWARTALERMLAIT
jgi:quinolinate synthase